MIHVAVVSEIRFFRESLARHLNSTEGMLVVATAPTSAEAAAEQATSIDVLVLDVANLTSPPRIRSLLEDLDDLRVVVIGLPDNEPAVIAYAEEGIAGFVSRESTLDDLRRAIVSAASDELVCTPSLAAALLRRVGHLAAVRRSTDLSLTLTPRELEITSLIDQGLSNKEIAAGLHIGVSTVKNHVHHILEKLNVGGRGQAAALIRSGLDRKY